MLQIKIRHTMPYHSWGITMGSMKIGCVLVMMAVLFAVPGAHAQPQVSVY